ncbi:hypothetical protein Syn7502_00991 [Synechococcus sp. PCC 7502]|uniref:DUF4335 domain-containing protein n=1 Tax=Synechococcus sp. PCC 7502 TaxID=1173263 RepID=UPI00029FC913|nr:DUF4335 domain-containing protein [Synechococcus sp. PCC 7502]AFY73106.1 hypothetical protein Syn7502_00991 [Synechococcus sp. PCC 7502]
MPIQRLYSLPSCTLQIEGISAEVGNKLSILTGFEFKFHHNGTKVTGGRDLLESLIRSTSTYVQALQAAIPTTVDDQSVRLEVVGDYLHKLSIKSSDLNQPVEISLDTVQLFDLTESIDQLCTDPQVMLDLKVVIEPVAHSSKSSVAVLPAFIGVSTLAIASAILLLIPPPKPPTLKPQPQSSSLNINHVIASNQIF